MRIAGIGIVIMIVLPGCEKIYFPDQPANTPEANFEIFWNDFDHYYGQFDIRHIDWDSVYRVYRPQVNSQSTNDELFTVFQSMIQLLKDGHVNVYAAGRVAGYDHTFPSEYYGDKLINPTRYIAFSTLQNTALEAGTVNDYNIGYIHILTFYSTAFADVDVRYTLIDDILEQLKDKDGIIIDVRGNGGGNSANAKTIASRFTTQRYHYFKQRYKTGPGQHDFSEWVNFYLEPNGKAQFNKKVVVLMSRYTFSTAELFVSAMHALPQVTLVGDTTGGGIGNPVYREMLNGWSYRLSTSIGALPDGTIIDGHGIYPQLAVVAGAEDALPETNRDVMLEKAIEVISK